METNEWKKKNDLAVTTNLPIIALEYQVHPWTTNYERDTDTARMSSRFFVQKIDQSQIVTQSLSVASCLPIVLDNIPREWCYPAEVSEGTEGLLEPPNPIRPGRKEGNKSFRLSAPPRMKSFSDIQYPSLDPFPSPTPSRRFLGRSSLDSSHTRSTKEKTLPDWVVSEYLSRTHQSNPSQKQEKQQDVDQRLNKGSRDVEIPRRRFKFNLTAGYATCKDPMLPLPPPGKVFYTLLEHSQVIEFNKDNVYHFPCLLPSPVAILHHPLHNNSSSMVTSKKKNHPSSPTTTTTTLPVKFLARFKLSTPHSLFLFRKKKKKST